MRNAAVGSEIRREEMIIMTQETKYICTVGKRFFTEGKTYEVIDDEFNCVRDDDGDVHEITLDSSNRWRAAGDNSIFLFAEESQDSLSSPEEDEEFQRIERKQQETVDCSVAVAHHIHELQKWLKHIGCDDEMELKITSDGLWVSPCAEELYGVKEGGVGTLIEYMRHIGGANKCLEKMEDLR